MFYYNHYTYNIYRDYTSDTTCVSVLPHSLCIQHLQRLYIRHYLCKCSTTLIMHTIFTEIIHQTLTVIVFYYNHYTYNIYRDCISDTTCVSVLPQSLCIQYLQRLYIRHYQCKCSTTIIIHTIFREIVHQTLPM